MSRSRRGVISALISLLAFEVVCAGSAPMIPPSLPADSQPCFDGMGDSARWIGYALSPAKSSPVSESTAKSPFLPESSSATHVLNPGISLSSILDVATPVDISISKSHFEHDQPPVASSNPNSDEGNTDLLVPVPAYSVASLVFLSGGLFYLGKRIIRVRG